MAVFERSSSVAGPSFQLVLPLMLNLNTTWFAETLQVGLVGVYGMGGVGNTLLSKIIYHTDKSMPSTIL